MYGDERLTKIDRAYSIFNGFQMVTLGAGILASILIRKSFVWEWVFFFAFFGGTVAFILFGIITMNITDRTMMDRYSDVRPRKGFRLRLWIGTRVSLQPEYYENLNDPMIEEAYKNHDQLALDVYKKSGRTLMLGALNIVLPIMVVCVEYILL